ncbi:MAG: 30S ribosomal protein S3 [Chthonomonadales bacterium]|nr:30S ribosomal protein S3 [Chthonomonadales bacterium]
MGQKIHPIGFRVGVIRGWESKWYSDKGYADGIRQDNVIRRWIRKNLSSAAVSRTEIERQGDATTVTIYTAKPGILIGKGGKGIEDVRTALQKLTKSQVHVNIQEIRYPDIDAQLVADSIAQQVSKRIAYKRAMRQAILRAMRLGAKGIRVSCAGRLGGSEMARREHMRDGKIPLHTLRADIDYGFSEGPTTYGNIGIKVWIYKGDVLPGSERATEADIVPRREAMRADRGGRSGDRGDRGGRGRSGGRGRGRGRSGESGGGTF